MEPAGWAKPTGSMSFSKNHRIQCRIIISRLEKKKIPPNCLSLLRVLEQTPARKPSALGTTLEFSRTDLSNWRNFYRGSRPRAISQTVSHSCGSRFTVQSPLARCVSGGGLRRRVVPGCWSSHEFCLVCAAIMMRSYFKVKVQFFCLPSFRDAGQVSQFR